MGWLAQPKLSDFPSYPLILLAVVHLEGDPSAPDSNISTVSLIIGAVNDTRTVTTLEDTSYVFKTSDFGFSNALDNVGEQASSLHVDGMSALPGIFDAANFNKMTVTKN